jgi:uncharacterized protein (TIGR02391 family)
MTKNKLRMTFDPATIEHLGIQMYSTLPPVMAELIANAHDADAPAVDICLKDDGATKEIIVSDKGTGMSFHEINDKFLRIGRNRRSAEGSQTTAGGRKIIGKKGLGKLSFFGIANEIEITTKKNGKENVFLMNWEKIKHTKDKEYHPDIIKKDESCASNDHGTIIILRGLHRESPFDPESLSVALSKIFIVDKYFQVKIGHNFDKSILVQNEKKYEGLEKEVEWNVPEDITFASDYSRRAEITGHLIATVKPIPARTNMRGVTLFSRKKLVNEPEYFSESTSSHFFSYLTGWLEVDFIDDLEEDVITTNRQSLRWGHPEMVDLRDHLRQLMNWLERDWREKREAIRTKKIAEATGVNTEEWFSKLPDELRGKVESIVQAITKESELPTEISIKAVRSFHDIVPEYPKYHWRYLHPEVQRVSKSYYESKNYYTAFLEVAKRYVEVVRKKSGVTQPNDRPVVEQAFKCDPPGPILSVTETFKKSDGTLFKRRTLDNIKEAQRMFSVGVVCGGRNVVDHEEIEELRTSGLFREEDCLDALSLLSHLFWRLDNSKKIR